MELDQKSTVRKFRTVQNECDRIIFGVDDKTHQVIGIPRDIVFSEMDAITAAISDSCEPLIIPDVYLQQIEDKAVIVVEISPGKQRPYYIKSLGIKGGTYIRVAGTDRLADHDLTAESTMETKTVLMTMLFVVILL